MRMTQTPVSRKTSEEHVRVITIRKTQLQSSMKNVNYNELDRAFAFSGGMSVITPRVLTDVSKLDLIALIECAYFIAPITPQYKVRSTFWTVFMETTMMGTGYSKTGTNNDQK